MSKGFGFVSFPELRVSIWIRFASAIFWVFDIIQQDKPMYSVRIGMKHHLIEFLIDNVMAGYPIQIWLGHESNKNDDQKAMPSCPTFSMPRNLHPHYCPASPHSPPQKQK